MLDPSVRRLTAFRSGRDGGRRRAGDAPQVGRAVAGGRMGWPGGPFQPAADQPEPDPSTGRGGDPGVVTVWERPTRVILTAHSCSSAATWLPGRPT
jgi:hypothetical protein